MLSERESSFCSIAVIFLALLSGCATPVRQFATLPATAPAVSVQTLDADLSSTRLRFDVYVPEGDRPAPLVVVAHGWLRGRAQMAGWGKRLAEEGFIAAVPDLPTFSDHPFNARAMNELITWLCSNPSLSSHIDSQRIGIIGFSSGGLSSLLAAVDNPKIRIWVGLDPVELRGLGVEAAKHFHQKAVIVRAPPSSWNHEGNAVAILRSLPGGCADIVVPDAIHIDPEWPTDWQMELLMGKSSEARRQLFVQDALGALRTELMNDHAVAESKSRYNPAAFNSEQ
jgi:dienelactone hydrolase